MPTVELKFDLSDQQDSKAFDRSCKAWALCSVLWDHLQLLRARDKHGNCEVCAELREKLYLSMNENGIDIDQLTL